MVGGWGGIGRTWRGELAAKGARVTAHLESCTCDDWRPLAGTGAATLVLEARDSAAVDAALQQVHATHGRLDGVVNCAGSILLKPAHLITDAEFAETLALNLTTRCRTCCVSWCASSCVNQAAAASCCVRL